jgi:hypothetical protein
MDHRIRRVPRLPGIAGEGSFLRPPSVKWEVNRTTNPRRIVVAPLT